MRASDPAKGWLIVDDLSDTGETLEKIKQQLEQQYSNIKMRTAVIWIKEGSTFNPDFFASRVPKVWIHQPFEDPSKPGGA